MLDKDDDKVYPPYVVVIKSDCMYCTDAINLLESKKIQFDCIDLSNNKVCLVDIQKNYNHYTVPLIFNSSVGFIGGYSNLVKHLTGTTT